MFTATNIITASGDQLHVAYAVLFPKESDLVFKNHGLQVFLDHEKRNVEIPMNEGQFEGFLEVLKKLQKKLQELSHLYLPGDISRAPG
ncbi:unnamed protein product [Oreochromis niloticus]|nr:unnamed protein product [Mustela putorius furo]